LHSFERLAQAGGVMEANPGKPLQLQFPLELQQCFCRNCPKRNRLFDKKAAEAETHNFLSFPWFLPSNPIRQNTIFDLAGALFTFASLEKGFWFYPIDIQQDMLYGYINNKIN